MHDSHLTWRSRIFAFSCAMLSAVVTGLKRRARSIFIRIAVVLPSESMNTFLARRHQPCLGRRLTTGQISAMAARLTSKLAY